MREKFWFEVEGGWLAGTMPCMETWMVRPVYLQSVPFTILRVRQER